VARERLGLPREVHEGPEQHAAQEVRAVERWQAGRTDDEAVAAVKKLYESAYPEAAHA